MDASGKDAAGAHDAGLGGRTDQFADGGAWAGDAPPGAAWSERIVVGADGSSGGRLAAQWGAREAREHHWGLTLARALPVPILAAGIGPVAAPTWEISAQLRRDALAELTVEAGELGILDTRLHTEIGSPTGMLLEASAQARMIVIGSRGLGGFAGLLLGSTGAQVGPHARCPVVVVRGTAVDDLRNVVVGVDGSPASRNALAFAFAEASAHGGRLTVVHAWELPAYDLLVVPADYYPWSVETFAGEEVRLAAEVLAGFRDRYPDVEVVTQVVRGRPVDALLGAAAQALLVVGTHGHGPVMGAVLGSVSHGVLHRAQGPVAIVPPEGYRWS